MSRQERGVIRLIWKNFVASIRPNFGRRKLIGEDYNGTKYYEDPIATYSNKKRAPRYFVPVNKDDHEQDLPAEWESWLRYRRQDPPTKEEVERNYQIALSKKKNATEIEAMYSEGKTKHLDVPKQKQGADSFPEFEEYKDHGKQYKPKTRSY